MADLPIERNLKALQTLYPQAEGEVRPVNLNTVPGLPAWIRGAVTLYQLPFLGAPSAPLYLVLPNAELEFEQLARIYRELADKLQAPILVIADALPPKHRPLLVKFRIPFIYKDESIFSPQLGLKFSNLNSMQASPKLELEQKNEGLSPFSIKILAGVLTNQTQPNFSLKLLHEHLQKKRFKFSLAKISPTLNELADHGLLIPHGSGPRKTYSKVPPQVVWQRVLELKLAPFFREIKANYIPKDEKSYVVAGESALAQYSNLADPKHATIAMSTSQFRAAYDHSSKTIPYGDFGNPSTVQIWKEDPHLFSINGALNPIELYLSMRDHPDERIQKELAEILIPYGLSEK